MECSLSIGGNLRKALRPAKYKLLKLPLVFAAARDLWGLAVRKFVTRWGKPVFHREISLFTDRASNRLDARWSFLAAFTAEPCVIFRCCESPFSRVTFFFLFFSCFFPLLLTNSFVFAVLKMNRGYLETTSRENYCVPGTKETRDKDDEQIIFRRNLERRLSRGSVGIDNISVVVSGKRGLAEIVSWLQNDSRAVRNTLHPNEIIIIDDACCCIKSYI